MAVIKFFLPFNQGLTDISGAGNVDEGGLLKTTIQIFIDGHMSFQQYLLHSENQDDLFLTDIHLCRGCLPYSAYSIDLCIKKNHRALPFFSRPVQGDHVMSRGLLD